MRFDNGYLKCDYRDKHDQRQWAKKRSTTGFYNHVLLHPTYIDTLALQKRKPIWYFRLRGNDSESFSDVKETSQSTSVILNYITHSCTLVHSHSNIWRYSPATKIKKQFEYMKFSAIYIMQSTFWSQVVALSLGEEPPTSIAHEAQLASQTFWRWRKQTHRGRLKISFQYTV